MDIVFVMALENLDPSRRMKATRSKLNEGNKSEMPKSSPPAPVVKKEATAINERRLQSWGKKQ